MKDDLKIGVRIRNVRENLHLSREIFSEKINISESFLAQIERGERSLSLKTLMTICENTGCSSDYLLFGDNADVPTSKKVARIVNSLPSNSSELVYEITRNIKSFVKKENI